MPKIEKLWVYPVKSCGAVAVESSAILPEGGLEGDREWIVTDAGGNMLWQGNLPRMTLVRVGLKEGILAVGTPEGDEVAVPRDHEGFAVPVRQYGFHFDGIDAGEDAARLLSDWLSHSVRLVRVGTGAHRWPKVNNLSLLSEASIAALNERLQEKGHAPMTPQRFRPNVLVSGLPAFGEETCQMIEFDGAAIKLVKTSIRCELVNISLEDATRERQPLPMIARMSRERTTARKASLGVYCRASGSALKRGMSALSRQLV